MHADTRKIEIPLQILFKLYYKHIVFTNAISINEYLHKCV